MLWLFSLFAAADTTIQAYIIVWAYFQYTMFRHLTLLYCSLLLVWQVNMLVILCCRCRFSFTFHYLSGVFYSLLHQLWAGAYSYRARVVLKMFSDDSSKLIMINVSSFRMQIIKHEDSLTMLNWSNSSLIWSPDICWMHLLNDIKMYYLWGAGVGRYIWAYCDHAHYFRRLYLHSQKTVVK